jgi:stage V sporulation protein D (sporulation-specific penicillin-binding protein)
MYDQSSSLIQEQKKRMSLISLLVLIFFILVLGRLVERQIFEHSYFVKLARQQRLSNEIVPAQRGKILVEERDDNTLYPLATNVSLYALQAIPHQIKQPALVASKLMPFLVDSGLLESDLIAKLSTGAQYLPPLKRKISEEEANKILDLDLDGVYMVSDKYRYNPEDTMAAQVLGFVNRDNLGQYGLEGYFNKELGGKSGYLEAERDPFGGQIALGKRESVNPQDGLDIVITLDRAVQYHVERSLEEAVKKHQAEKGSVIIMEPATGKIIAMAQYPTFDPNNYNKESVDLFTSLNTTQVYESGSVFKTITMAAGIDAGVVTAASTYTDTGEAVINDRTIRNSDKLGHGVQNMTEVLEKSLNTGVVYVVQKLGKNLFNKYLKGFGFEEPTGVELAGEVSGHVKELINWSDIDLATMAFGQGIAITPMQLVQAVGAIANGGKMMQPHIVDRILYPSGAVAIEPTVKNQPISEEAAKVVAAMMVSVVERGHGKRAGVPGYYIGGKTGTAQIPDPQHGGYLEGPTIGTFVGFGPAENPRFVMMTRIDKPKDVQYAESSAAPLFGQIAKFLLDYYRIPPTR